MFYKLWVTHLKLHASRAFWLVAYPSQEHERLFDANTRSFSDGSLDAIILNRASITFGTPSLSGEFCIGIYTIVSLRLRALDIQTAHLGRHALHHSCAAKLLADELNLKEIGDHLGHRSTSATMTYKKVDLTSLRQVAVHACAQVACTESQVNALDADHARYALSHWAHLSGASLGQCATALRRPWMQMICTLVSPCIWAVR